MRKCSISEFHDFDDEDGSGAFWVAILEGELWRASSPARRQDVGVCMDCNRGLIDGDELEAKRGLDGVNEGGTSFLLGLEALGRVWEERRDQRK